MIPITPAQDLLGRPGQVALQAPWLDAPCGQKCGNKHKLWSWSSLPGQHVVKGIEVLLREVRKQNDCSILDTLFCKT